MPSLGLTVELSGEAKTYSLITPNVFVLTVSLDASPNPAESETETYGHFVRTTLDKDFTAFDNPAESQTAAPRIVQLGGDISPTPDDSDAAPEFGDQDAEE